MKRKLFIGVVLVLSVISLSVYLVLFMGDLAPEDNSAASIYYLSPNGSDTNAGTNTSPWKTMTKADASASPGDTIILKDGIYPAYSRIEKSGLTWKAENRHKAIIDGGFAPGMLNNSWDNIVNVWNSRCSSQGRFAALLSLRNTNNVTIDGLFLRNSCGRGLGISTENGGTMKNVTVKNVIIDWTISSGLYANPDESESDYPARMDNFQFLNNSMTRTSVGDEYHVRVPGACQPKDTPLSELELKYCVNISAAIGGMNSVVRGNTFAWGEGELAPQPGSKGLLFEDNTVVGNKNSFYAGMVEDAVVKNNLFYAPEEKKPKAGGDDETDATGFWRFGLRNEKGHLKTGNVMNTNIAIYNNLIVNMGFFITGSNKSHIGDNNQIYFGNNTLIAGNELSTLLSVQHEAATSGDPKVSGILENNIFDRRKNPTSKITIKLSGNDALTVRNNIFPKALSTSIKGTGNVFQDNPGLVNSTIPLNIKYPNIGPDNLNLSELLTAVNVANYYPISNSISINAGTSAGPSNNTGIPTSVRSQDYLKSARVSMPDIGAIELNSENAPDNTPIPTSVGTIVPTTTYPSAKRIVVRAKARYPRSESGVWPKLEIKIGDPTTTQPTVHTFDVMGTTYRNYRYTHNVPFDVTQVKIKFINDGTQRDVYVDKITIGTTVYQTEDPDTFSTGTWSNEAGTCVGGYYSTELLHCNGYFQYKAK